MAYNIMNSQLSMQYFLFLLRNATHSGVARLKRSVWQSSTISDMVVISLSYGIYLQVTQTGGVTPKHSALQGFFFQNLVS